MIYFSDTIIENLLNFVLKCKLFIYIFINISIIFHDLLTLVIEHEFYDIIED